MSRLISNAGNNRMKILTTYCTVTRNSSSRVERKFALTLSSGEYPLPLEFDSLFFPIYARPLTASTCPLQPPSSRPVGLRRSLQDLQTATAVSLYLKINFFLTALLIEITYAAPSSVIDLPFVQQGDGVVPAARR